MMSGTGKNLLSMDTQLRLLGNSNGFFHDVNTISGRMMWAKGFSWGLISAFFFWFLFFSNIPW